MPLERSDFEHFDLCDVCKGTGKLTTFQWDDPCKKCEGAGWLDKGQGWNLTEAVANGIKVTQPAASVEKKDSGQQGLSFDFDDEAEYQDAMSGAWDPFDIQD